MLRPDPIVVREIQRYDSKLFVEWNNKDQLWEVWIKRPWGKRLITPIVESIYVEGGGAKKFYPLDRRIIEWLYLADTQRKGLPKKWKWLDKAKHTEMLRSRKLNGTRIFTDIVSDNYSIFNQDFMNPLAGGDDDWNKPDVKSSCRDSVMHRSAENAREYFKE